MHTGEDCPHPDDNSPNLSLALLESEDKALPGVASRRNDQPISQARGLMLAGISQ